MRYYNNRRRMILILIIKMVGVLFREMESFDHCAWCTGHLRQQLWYPFSHQYSQMMVQPLERRAYCYFFTCHILYFHCGWLLLRSVRRMYLGRNLKNENESTEFSLSHERSCWTKGSVIRLIAPTVRQWLGAHYPNVDLSNYLANKLFHNTITSTAVNNSISKCHTKCLLALFVHSLDSVQW